MATGTSTDQAFNIGQPSPSFFVIDSKRSPHLLRYFPLLVQLRMARHRLEVCHNIHAQNPIQYHLFPHFRDSHGHRSYIYLNTKPCVRQQLKLLANHVLMQQGFPRRYSSQVRLDLVSYHSSRACGLCYASHVPLEPLSCVC